MKQLKVNQIGCLTALTRHGWIITGDISVHGNHMGIAATVWKEGWGITTLRALRLFSGIPACEMLPEDQPSAQGPAPYGDQLTFQQTLWRPEGSELYIWSDERKGKHLRQILYLARLSFKFDGEIKDVRQAKGKTVQHGEASFIRNKGISPSKNDNTIIRNMKIAIVKMSSVKTNIQ